VDVKEGYLQDPAGCNTFYGCRLPSESSEGYLRTRYKCPGGTNGLRFHPGHRFCTYKTSVPDTMCNSHIAVQAILGTQESDQAPEDESNSEGEPEGAATQSENTSSSQTGDSSATADSESGDAGSGSSDTSEDPATEAPTEETEAPADGAVDSTNTAAAAASSSSTAEEAPESPSDGEVETFDSNTSTSDGSVFRVVTPGERPAKPLSDIDKIAQVIKGQLLTRRKQEEANSKI